MNLRPRYRVRQFLGALGSGAKPAEEGVLRTHLNTAQITLFRRLSVADQAHALVVLHTLQRNGRSVPRQATAATLERVIGAEAALAQAALLHDVGKVQGRIRVWHRVATVLLQAVCPTLVCRLALDEPHSWRYPFFVLLHHAERGADLSAQAGTNALAVTLIRAHHTAPEESGLDAPSQALLAALQSADEQN